MGLVGTAVLELHSNCNLSSTGLAVLEKKLNEGFIKFAHSFLGQDLSNLWKLFWTGIQVVIWPLGRLFKKFHKFEAFGPGNSRYSFLCVEVNPLVSCQTRPVYLTTLFPGQAAQLTSTVLCTFFCQKLTAALFNHQKEENDSRKYFMVIIHKRMLLDQAKIEPATSWSPFWHNLNSIRFKRSCLSWLDHFLIVSLWDILASVRHF